MAQYQVIARKFRPQAFNEVIGQEAIVATLLNSIKLSRVGHAYLFSGSRGTGKTTLARLFAKALNCRNRKENGEPCNCCPQCVEISKGSSLDVLEIDGASHRGIEDIRRLHESIAMMPASSSYKIYLIDEVHMLTKEAFNALLKSLEEPPAHVKFFFATTEPQKIPPTIISRCQRFQLSRLSDVHVIDKLSRIATTLEITVETGVLEKIARLSEGSMRDAESLFDELSSFYGNDIRLTAATELFGLISDDLLFSLDAAISQNNLNALFDLISQIMTSGRSVDYFIEELILHYRNHLLLKRGMILPLTNELKAKYLLIKDLYSEENCLDILEMLTEALQQEKSFSERTFLEMLFLRLYRLPKKPSLALLVKRLAELEKSVSTKSEKAPPAVVEQPLTAILASSRADLSQPLGSPEKPQIQGESVPIVENKPNDGIKKKGHADTLTRFTAKELSGALKLEDNRG